VTTITISRQFGSQGDEIVEKICRILGYHQFGKIDIARAAYEAGLATPEAVDYSEDNYKVKNFIDRLLKRPVTVAQLHVWKEDAVGIRTMDLIDIDEESAMRLVQRAIKIAYQAGNMVIVGRAGQAVLRGMANTLHVRIEADLEDRIHCIKSDLKAKRGKYGAVENVEARRLAQDLIMNHDAASAAYIKQFYGYDWSDPMLYDLMINTSHIQPDKAAQMIVDRVPAVQPAN
jgi:cytidylate kinase